MELLFVTSQQAHSFPINKPFVIEAKGRTMKLIPFDENKIALLIEGMPDWMHPIQWWRRQFYMIADENVGITLDREMRKMKGIE
jgi:hypothetical protein